MAKRLPRSFMFPSVRWGKEHGILAAVRMDRMEPQRGRLVRVLENPWVAFCETPLSARHRYEMLLHGELTL